MVVPSFCNPVLGLRDSCVNVIASNCAIIIAIIRFFCCNFPVNVAFAPLTINGNCATIGAQYKCRFEAQYSSVQMDRIPKSVTPYGKGVLPKGYGFRNRVAWAPG